MGKFLKKHLITIILTVILLAGLCLLLYPTVADRWNRYHQSRAVASYIEAVDDMSQEEAEAKLEAARAYNERLARSGTHFFMTDEELEEYNSILDITGTGIMGYIQIPSIDVNFPIYHGTDETILQIAIGHLAGTSFPISGESVHAALSGHRGLPSARLFTDLDRLVEGDVFTVSVLHETATYQIDQIRIVLPEEVSELAIEDGKEYCTLITCTPYGVNSHRMLIRGHRIDNEEAAVVVTGEARRVPSYLVVPAIAVPMLFLMLLLMLIYYSIRPPKKSQEQIMKELRELPVDTEDKRGEDSKK